jgi:hypothetical protein
MTRSRPNGTDDYQATIVQAVQAAATFRQLTASRKPAAGSASGGLPWIRINVRPVLLKNQRHLQFTYFDGTKTTVKNFAAGIAEACLQEALALPFTQFHLQTAGGDLHVRVTRKGHVLVSRGKPSCPEPSPEPIHDRVRPRAAATESPDAFLQAIGLIKKQGGGKTVTEDKFRQVYEFIRVVLQTALKRRAPASSPDQPLRVIDAGCGSSYLSFALFHYLNHVCGVPAAVSGVDRSADAIRRCVALRDALGWDGPAFYVSPIAAFEPETPPDVVLSLHACDTATDEAIAQGIRWGSDVILVVPCCQHELLEAPPRGALQPLLRHGVFKERLAAVVTDTLRTQVLRIMGYHAEVVEFIALEHTAKNVMIRAERTARPGNATAAKEYAALTHLWGTTPAIERLLGDVVRPFLPPGPGPQPIEHGVGAVQEEMPDGFRGGPDDSQPIAHGVGAVEGASGASSR